METQHETPQIENVKVNHKKRTVTVTLDYPVEWGDTVYEKITIKSPKGRHVKNLGEGFRINDLLKIASKCSGVSFGVFEEMESSDAMKVAEAVGELL